jgi:hypothetical protein
LRLHEWLFDVTVGEVYAEIAREASASVGAAVIGRRTFDVGVGVWNDTPFAAPYFVPTHEKGLDERVEGERDVRVRDGRADGARAGQGGGGRGVRQAHEGRGFAAIPRGRPHRPDPDPGGPRCCWGRVPVCSTASAQAPSSYGGSEWSSPRASRTCGSASRSGRGRASEVGLDRWALRGVVAGVGAVDHREVGRVDYARQKTD